MSRPAWTAQDCLRRRRVGGAGPVSIGPWSTSLPWRLTHVQDIPAVDIPAADGVATAMAGPDGGNGEFDTPIDPRFPTYLATNLSEALPGPFSPSSASVTVKGLRASGAVIAETSATRRADPARNGHPHGRSIRPPAVRRHHHRALHGRSRALRQAGDGGSAEPVLRPECGVHADPRRTAPAAPNPRSAAGPLRTIRNLAVFGVNLAGLIVGANRDTEDFVGDIERLEEIAAGDLSQLTEPRSAELDPVGPRPRHRRLGAGIRVFHGLRRAQHDPARPERPRHGAAGRSGAGQCGPVERRIPLADAARRDPEVLRILAGDGDHLDELATRPRNSIGSCSAN